MFNYISPIIVAIIFIIIIVLMIYRILKNLQNGFLKGRYGIIYRANSPISFYLTLFGYVIFLALLIYLLGIMNYASIVNPCFKWTKNIDEIIQCTNKK